MATQAEIWCSLRLQAYKAMFPLAMTEQERKAWLALVKIAVQPQVWWEGMFLKYQGRHVRITRFDFPDHSSAVASETWRAMPMDSRFHDMDERDAWKAPVTWGYELTWMPVPIQ